MAKQASAVGWELRVCNQYSHKISVMSATSWLEMMAEAAWRREGSCAVG